jgi:hypothetical protein
LFIVPSNEKDCVLLAERSPPFPEVIPKCLFVDLFFASLHSPALALCFFRFLLQPSPLPFTILSMH